MKRLLIFVLIVMAMVPSVRAQTSFYSDRALQQVNVLTSPTPLTAAIPYGPVRVCSLPLTQQSPCLPLATITDINGNAISNSIGPLFGQLTTDATGRFTFGCTLGLNYQVQVAASASNTPAVNYPITCPGVGSGPQFNGNVTVSSPGSLTVGAGANTSLTNLTVSGTGTLCNIDVVLYVGGTNPCGFAGTDIGAQLNSAYASLASTGGSIQIIPNSSGACYNYSTPIVLNTAGKPVLLQGMSPASTTGVTVITGAVCLNYTPTTATSAMTLDWTVTTGQGGFFESSAGVRNITLINNGCTTSQGCGSSATGIQVGGTNGGAHSARIANMRILGFSTGIHNVDTTGKSWGIVYDQVGLAANSIGYQQDGVQEATQFIAPKIANNATGYSISGSLADFYIWGGSCDYNLTTCIAVTSGNPIIVIHGGHWECCSSNGNVHFVTGSPRLVIEGGYMHDTNASGASTNIFTCLTCDVVGLVMDSLGGGIAASNFVFSPSSSASIQVENQATQFTPGNILSVGASADLTINNGATTQHMTGSTYSMFGTPVFGTAAPTISSGFGTTPSIVNAGGSLSFTINVGTGGTATSGVISFAGLVGPFGSGASSGWNVFCTDTSTFSTTVFITKQTASTTTTATIGNFNSSAVAAAWASGDILSCIATAR